MVTPRNSLIDCNVHDVHLPIRNDHRLAYAVAVCIRHVFSGYPSLFNSRRKSSVLKGPPHLLQANASYEGRKSNSSQSFSVHCAWYRLFQLLNKYGSAHYITEFCTNHKSKEQKGVIQFW